jgi:hypothetical protein
MATESTAAPVPIYEQRLDQDGRWALSEGSRFFEEKSAVQDALRAITRRLGDLGIPYAVAGGMALFRHGFRRFTEDVDILVTSEGLKAIHDHLEGRGYLPPFAGSKNLRDTENGVRIEFLVAGQYPGDGHPKPVAFPDPATAGVEIDGIRYLNLATLVELKLASGMTGGLHRMQDLVDVVALIKTLKLPAEFADRLNPYVRDKYIELWSGLQGPPPEPR